MPRLFIAAIIPEKVKKEILSQKLQKKFGENLRWVPSQNIHLTLIFLGQSSEKDLKKIKNILKETVNKISSPLFLTLNKVSLGPNKKRPRLAWVEGTANEELLNFVKNLKNNLSKENIFFDQKYSFRPHITLARSKGKELWNKNLEEKMNLTFPIKEIALMESKLKKEGAEYKILESTFLK